MCNVLLKGSQATFPLEEVSTKVRKLLSQPEDDTKKKGEETKVRERRRENCNEEENVRGREVVEFLLMVEVNATTSLLLDHS